MTVLRSHSKSAPPDGSGQAALEFMDEAAELQGHNVGEDRRHGPVLWDDVPRGHRKRR